MASTKALVNKDGEIYAYKITVFLGRIGEKQVSRYSTWKIPDELKKSPAKMKKALEQEKVRFETECKSGLAPSEKKNFAEYAEYVLQLKERDKKHSTVFRYRELLERINPEIGFLKLADIRPEHLNTFYMKLSKPGANKNTGSGLSPKTIMEHHRLIHLICSQALKEGLVNFNVADRATPPAVKKKEAEFFEIADINKILDCLDCEPLKWQCITQLLIHTGARRGEIMALKWKNIDFKNCKINICANLLYSTEKGIYEDSPKTGKNRTIDIPETIVNLLKAFRREQFLHQIQIQQDSCHIGYCFTQENGKPMHPDSVTDWLDKFSKKNGLPHIHPHKFRHTFASITLAGGANIVDVARALGHEQVSTTENIYAHVLEKGVKEVSNTFESALLTKGE